MHHIVDRGVMPYPLQMRANLCMKELQNFVKSNTFLIEELRNLDFIYLPPLLFLAICESIIY
ncbi:hypothetical protein NUACC26_098020 [Scytonema sp. NUACC26]